MTAHIKYGAVERFISKSDDDWYGVAKQVGEHVNKRARRSDITAVVSTEAGMGAPACFIPSLAEMHINTSVCDLGAVERVDIHDKLWALSHAPAVGAMDHEAAHAAHTRFDPRDLMESHDASRKMIDVITTLEEPRIERFALRSHPDSLTFLRGCAMEIVGRDFKIPDSRYGAAAAAGLLLARHDAGVLTKREVKGFRHQIEAVLGTETLEALEPLWQRFLRLHDEDFAGMVDVAREWLEVLGEDPEDTEGMVAVMLIGEPLPGDGEAEDGDGDGSGSGDGDGDGEGEGSEGKGGSGEGDGEDGDGEAEGFGDSIMGKVREAEVKIDKEVVGKRADEKSERRRAERKADAERRSESEKPHGEAFGSASKGLHGFTPGGFAHLTGTRQPNADERRAARRLAATLEKIDYHDRAVTKVSSIVPPGRLRGRMAVQEAAARGEGRDFDGALWVGKRRKRVESTPLTIGFAVDISGSMNSAMEPLASSQWVTSTAGAHIDAKVASVHFGDRVHGIAPAGYREREVRTFYPGDGSEAFKDAALALDKELHLLDGTGARLLFVASDGIFVDSRHAEYARKFVPLAIRKGVGVIFLNFTGGCNSYGGKVVNCTGMSPVDVANEIGKAAVAELRRLDRRTA